MSLSNKATPKYYGIFREKVLRGEIPVNDKISMEMNRIDKLIANPGVYYDNTAMPKWIRFCETEMTLTDGSDLHLLYSFKLWAEQLYSWYYFVERSVYVPYPNQRGGRYVRKRVKKRLIRIQYLIVGRGAAKSLYESCIQAYSLTVVSASTHQITTAPTMPQAEEVMSPIRTALVRARGPLFKMLTYGSHQNTTGSKLMKPKLYSSKKGIEYTLTNSLLEVRPMSVDKLQGLRVYCATVDEWLSGDVREDVIDCLQQGAAKEQSSLGDNDYCIIAVSSEGTVRNGVGDTIKMDLMKILKGEFDDIHTSIWWYALDDISEVKNPDMWVKANPNLGHTVTYETYQLAVERAERDPAARNDILAKRFGLPMEGFTYFFTYQETLMHRFREYWQMSCSMGADLSRGDDFCAFTFLFPLPNDDFGIKVRAYITETTLNKLAPAMRIKYDEFINEGTLIIMEGSILDIPDVYDDLDTFIDTNNYDVETFGYDPYNAKDFVELWVRDNGPFGVEKVIQGSRTESVPLGELKNLAEDRHLLFDESLMSFCMGNAIAIIDTNGNRKLAKRRDDEKIDTVSAMLDAFVAYKLHREAFD